MHEFRTIVQTGSWNHWPDDACGPRRKVEKNDIPSDVQISSFPTIHLLNQGQQIAEFNDARTAAFTGRLPASATVHSLRLVRDGLLVEVEALAVLGAD